MKKNYLITTFLVVLALLFVSCDNPASPETPDAGNGVDKTALTTAISVATNLKNSVTIGTAPGEYLQADVNIFTAAIAAAQTVADYTDPTQTEVDTAVSDLADATTIFNNSVILEIVASTAGTVNFASLLDTWGSGTVFDEPYTTDNKYDSVIKATSGTNWGPAFCAAFMNIPANVLLRYTNMEFKIKTTDYTTVKVQMTGATNAEPQFSLADGTELEGGWIQMSIPLSTFGTLALNQTQFAILEHSAGTVYITDVEFTGEKAIDASYLQNLITEAETLNAAHDAGTNEGEVPSEAKTEFTDAIAASQTIATAAASWDSLDAEIVVLSEAIDTFDYAIILPSPVTVPVPSDVIGDIGAVLMNSGAQYAAASAITINSWTPGWGEVGVPTTEVIDSKTVNKFTTLGWAIAQTSTFDATNHHFLHVDFYAPKGTHFLIKVTDAASGEKEFLVNSTSTPGFSTGEWISVDIDLTDPSLFGTDPITQINTFVFAGNVGGEPETGIVYIDNIYFHQ